MNEIAALQEALAVAQTATQAALDRAQKAEREIKRLDPDPVVCGCREALCPHTPIAMLPRQALVDHFKARIKSIEAAAEAKLEKAERERDEWKENADSAAQQLFAKSLDCADAEAKLEKAERELVLVTMDRDLWRKEAEFGKAKLATQSQEMVRLKAVEHAAWHVCESSEERVVTREIVVDRHDFYALAELLSEDCPSVEETNKG